MSSDPILLVGGSGVIGRSTVRSCAPRFPMPVLIVGRGLARARNAAAESDGAEGVVLDLTANDLGPEGAAGPSASGRMSPSRTVARLFAAAESAIVTTKLGEQTAV